jgi:signal transduction histidine kinase
VHLLTGLPLGVISALTMATLLVLIAASAITMVFATVFLVLLLACIRRCTSLQRARFAVLLGVRLPDPERSFPGRTWLRRRFAEAASWATWREAGFHLATGVLGPVGFMVALAPWAAAALLVILLVRHETYGPALIAAAAAACVILQLLAPRVVRATAAADVAMARAALGGGLAERAADRRSSAPDGRTAVDRLTDAADAEHDRIERGLRDGAQRRLVSLAMNLGIARATLTNLPEPAQDAIAHAHDEAQQALSELQELVSGLRPAVLHECGLATALARLAARAPLPVRLHVDLPGRPAAATEAVAYFAASEALANAVAHAYATQVDISVRDTGSMLRVVIADDGCGGAKMVGGRSGLRGLARRAAAAGGTLRIDSQPGGPTLIVVELPCDW